jgi:diguanylate cyclase (GGDEF)-like protein
MLQIPHSLFDVTSAVISGGSLVACAVICLLQYAYSTMRQNRFRQEIEQFRREAEGLESELQSLNRDQSLTKFENQILREILGQTEFAKALDHLLRRFVPNPADGFAIFLQFDQEPNRPRQSRGLSDESCRNLQLDESLVDLLRVQKTLALENLALQRSRLFASLAPADRKKLRQLFLIGVGDDHDLFAVLITTSLLPIAAPREQQFELTSRLIASIAGNLRQTLILEKQSNQLRCTREMLELRSITDGKFDQPVKMLEKFIQRLAQMVSAERGVLYLSSREAGAGPKPAVRCGVQLQPGVSTAWHQHEDQLAESGAAYPQAVYFDAARLQKVQVQTLIGSAVTLPILQNGAPIGLLCLTRRTPAEFTAVQKQLLNWAADTLSQAMQRTFSYVAIERQARLDGLTELANRRTFDAQIHREVEQVQSGGQVECSLLLMDLDRFKSINDQYGHQAGDEVLRSTAQVLRDQVSRIRSGDRALLARYGGEELAALLPGVGIAGALRIADSIRQAVEQNVIDAHGQTIQVTISIGVATCPLHAKTSAELIAAADLALYHAKSNGRNQVGCANEGAAQEAVSAAG